MNRLHDPKLRSREESGGRLDEPWRAADVAVPLGGIGGGYALTPGAPKLPYGMEHEEEERERHRR